MDLHKGNKDYVEILAMGQKDFQNFQYHLPYALKGNKRALKYLNLIE